MFSRAVGGRRGLAALGLLILVASPLYAPQLLAFPYRTATPVGTVWSERPVSPALLAQAGAKVRTRMAMTPLAGPSERRAIFLTDGGWRWRWLTVGSTTPYALSRPVTNAVVINRAHLVEEPPAKPTITRRRTLASLLAHEFTHGLIRRRYGVVPSLRFPAWKTEGYCDHIAGESTLDAEASARLEAAGRNHPALLYFRGRRRVEAALAANGGNVDSLFLGSR